jgi:hypothetical protein
MEKPWLAQRTLTTFITRTMQHVHYLNVGHDVKRFLTAGRQPLDLRLTTPRLWLGRARERDERQWYSVPVL